LVFGQSGARPGCLGFIAQEHEMVESEGKVCVIEHLCFANGGYVELETLDSQLA
jgi:hypothetical protein